MPIKQRWCPALHCAEGDDRNGFTFVRQLLAAWRRRPVPQQLDIAKRGWIIGAALQDVLKLFVGLIKLLLFV